MFFDCSFDKNKNCSKYITEINDKDTKPPILSKDPYGVVFEDVVGFGGSNFALDSDGFLWATGLNSTGELGIDGSDGETRWTKITENFDGNKILQMSRGSQSSMLLDDDNNVWVVGNNAMGVFGVGDTTNSTEWLKISKTFFNNEKIKKIKMGDTSYVLTEEGNFYVTGRNYYGELGIPEYTRFWNSFTPNWTKIDQANFNNKKIKDFERSSFSLYLIDEDGNIWTVGSNGKGQLGTGDYSESGNWNFIDKSFLNGAEIKKISGRSQSAHLLDSNGEIWAIGDNYNGQLGDGTRGPYYNELYWQKTPSNPFNGNKIIDIESSYEHAFAIDENNDVWAVGNNQNYELGLDSQIDYLRWTKIDHPEINGNAKALGGNAASFIITLDGKIYSIGDNYNGILGRDPEDIGLNLTDWTEVTGIDYWLDNDGDGVPDITEEEHGSDPADGSILPPDTDNDGLLNHLDDDDDNDGFLDVEENEYGTNPLDENDYPTIVLHSASNGLLNMTKTVIYFDDGGKDNKYSHNLNSTMVFNAPSGYKIELVIESIVLNQNDTLDIFSDATSTNKIESIIKSNDQNKEGKKYQHESFSFHFNSDNTKKGNGWKFKLSLIKK